MDIPGKGPIEFNGCILPETAKYFEVLPFFKDLSLEIRQWILDLRYAWARERRCESTLVLQACDELESRIYSEKETIFTHLAKCFPEVNPSEACEEWLFSIMTMRECAERLPECAWTTHPQPGEVAYFLTQTTRVAKSIIATQNATRRPDEQIPYPAVLNEIECKSEPEQIAFINSFVDGISDPPASPGTSPTNEGATF